MIRTNPPTAKLDVQAVQALVQSAIQLMLRGEWAAAESNYLRVLEAFPRHPDALHFVTSLGAAPSAKVTSTAWVAAAGWRWRPVANEKLLVVSGCTWAPAPQQGSCAFGVLREPDRDVIFATSTDRMIVAVELAGDRRKLRTVGFDSVGSYIRDLGYAYGTVDFSELRRH